MTDLADKQDEDLSRYDIIGMSELALANILPNLENPRPSFHLNEEDPELLALSESILTEGLHRPILVYELLGHYAMEDKPGHFVLLQGERRFRASGLAGLDTIKANIARTPRNKAEELELLSVEDAHKLPWQPYFEMVHAAHLAECYGVPIKHPDIANKTGLTMDQLSIAEKVFSLVPIVQDMVAEYEKMMYEQRVSGKRKRNGRLAGSGRKLMEFTPLKASICWDIFTALREHMTLTVKEYSDEELQLRIATWATNGANADDLSTFLQTVRQSSGANAEPGMVSKVHLILKDPSQIAVKTIMKTIGNSTVVRLSSISTRMMKNGRDAVQIAKKVDQFGTDVDVLEEVHSKLIQSIRNAEKLERAVSDRLHVLTRRS